MTCETCPAIFSRKKCLHQNCPSHEAELAAFRRKIDEHIQAMIIREWYPYTKAPGGSIPQETENNSAVSRTQSPKKYHHNAQTSGHHPGQHTAVGDSLSSRNHKQTFSAPTAAFNKRIASDLLPVRPPIFQPLSSAR